MTSSLLHNWKWSLSELIIYTITSIHNFIRIYWCIFNRRKRSLHHWILQSKHTETFKGRKFWVVFLKFVKFQPQNPRINFLALCFICWHFNIQNYFNLLFYFFQVFHITVSWRTFTGVWVTTSPLRSPGLFLIFWLISTMLYFGLSQFILSFPTLPVPFSKCANYNWYHHHPHVWQLS